MNAENARKFAIHKALSLLITTVGFLLMTFMVIVEDEPGAMPLLLIVFGAVWYVLTRSRIRSQKI